MDVLFGENKMQFAVKLNTSGSAETVFSQSGNAFDANMKPTSTRVDVEIGTGVKRLDATIKDYQAVTVYKDADPYTGSYQVTPKVNAQTMPTAQKLMTQDVTIKAIPIYDVSNGSGGRTVYIAKEV